MPRPILSSTSRVAPNPSQVIDRVVDGEALLIHLGSGDYYSLNAVGTRIWENLDGTKTVEDLARVIEAEYDVSPELARVDALNLVQELADEGFVVLVA